jgi:hypothetical protein
MRQAMDAVDAQLVHRDSALIQLLGALPGVFTADHLTLNGGALGPHFNFMHRGEIPATKQKVKMEKRRVGAHGRKEHVITLRSTEHFRNAGRAAPEPVRVRFHAARETAVVTGQSRVTKRAAVAPGIGRNGMRENRSVCSLCN